MNIFVYEMKQYKKSIITWSISFAVMIFIFMQAAPIFLEESAMMKEFLSSFPEEFIKGMNINVDTFFSEVGFYTYIFTYIGLAAAIQAMSMGLGIISKENRMKTADFLMSKPRSRVNIYIYKVIAAFCSIIITGIVFFISSIASVLIVAEESFDSRTFILISLTFFFIQIIYLALGLLIATLASKIKSVISVTMGIVFGTFMVGMISAIANSEALRYMSPLKYFDNNYIMTNMEYEGKYMLLSIGVVLLAIITSFIVYIKKDIKAV